jgi:putative transposase
MEEYFKNKYRVASTRLTDWDYSKEGFYFVTICTKDRKCNLGEIKNNNVYLSDIGRIIFNYWLEMPGHFNNVKLDDWIIMPNHLHGIIEILQAKDFGNEHCRDAPWRVSTRNKFAPLKPKSLQSIVNHFKGAVKRECNKNNLDFEWQPRYYEHIIKNDEDYARIKEYIANNPLNWELDRNNPINIGRSPQSVAEDEKY